MLEPPQNPGRFIKVEVFDFQDSKIVKFADLTLRFRDDVDLDPEEAIGQLIVETGWQVPSIFPHSFVLSRHT